MSKKLTPEQEQKHTPGPWTSRRGDHNDYPFRRILGKDGGLVAIARAAGGSEREAVANARIIAAAPGLLEALIVLVDHAQETYPHFESERGQRDINNALEAIKKARAQ